MSTTISLGNIHDRPWLQLFFSVVRTCKVYSFSNFQIYYTASLTVVNMLYITFTEFINPETGSLYLLTTFTHFSHPHLSPVASTNLFFVSMSSFCFFKIPHISEIIRYLHFSILFHLV